MEFQDVVRRRRMVRSYTDEPVDAGLLDRALENATHAPSAGFSQGWAFVVLDTEVDVHRFWTASSDDPAGRQDQPDRWLAGMRRAPVVVVPCSSKAAYLERYAQPDKGWTDRDETRWAMPFWHLDAAMASLLILQTVTDAGLGACFFGLVPHRVDAVRAELGIPATHDPIGAITIGHPAPPSERRRGAQGSPARRARTPWRDVVHRGGWRHTSSQPPARP